MVRTAELLQTAGDRKWQVGDRVATWLPNGLAWILVDMACQWLGYIHVALDTRLPLSMALDLVDHSQAHLVVVPEQWTNDFATRLPVLSAEAIEAGAPEYPSASIAELPLAMQDGAPSVTHDSPAQILYTSGTISRPKGALLSHRNLLSNARAKLQAAPQFSNDIRLNILPFAHAYARTCELSTWILSSSRLCIAPDWQTFLRAAPILEPTLINLVPFLVQRLMEQCDSDSNASALLGSRLRLLQVGGAALREDVWQRMAALGWPPLQGYGLTETSPVICSNRAGHQQFGSVGPPVEGVEVRIDQEQVLWTRGPHVMLGYWQDPLATSQRMRDGWFCTGDLAEQLPDGSVRIIGRSDDQITLSTGYKVSPLELSRQLGDDPWLEHIVLVGNNRPYVAALVYPRQSSEAATLDRAALLEAIIQRWRPLTGSLPRSMQIERVAIMPEPLTVENGGLNFKGAIRRAYVEQHLFRHQVEQLYASAEPHPLAARR